MPELPAFQDPEAANVGAAPPAPPQGIVPSLGDPGTAQKFFSDPKAMYAVAQLAAQHQQPSVIAWLERGHQAANENAIQATQALMAGDGEGAIKLFNMSGRHTDAKSAADNGDGTWTITRGNGATVKIDPKATMASFLSPKDFAEQQTKAAELGVHKQNAETNALQAKNLGEYQAVMGAAATKNADSNAELRTAQAQMAEQHWTAMREIAAAHDAGKAAVQAAQETARAALSKLGPMGLYQTAISELQKGGNTKPEDVPRLAAERLLRSTADVGKMDDGSYVLTGVTPDGKGNVIAQYKTEAEARKAYLEFFKGGPVPTGPTAPAEKKPGFIERMTPAPKVRGIGPPPVAAQPAEAAPTTQVVMARDQAMKGPAYQRLNEMIAAEGQKGEKADMDLIGKWQVAQKAILEAAGK